MSLYEEFIYKRTYSRYLEELKRREDWPESVARYYQFFYGNSRTNEQFRDACRAFINKEVVGSMRCLWSAGPALKRENACGFNCWYIDISSIHSFADYMYLLMCGGGVGYTVEKIYTNQLPKIPAKVHRRKGPLVVFEDSREGWRDGFERYLSYLYQGRILPYDLTKIRPKGSKLRTFGGRASGPEPLDHLLKWTAKLFKRARGRRLYPIECYDLCCHIASVIVAGGARRAASLALFDNDEQQMFNAKLPELLKDQPQRYYANNSVVFHDRPDRLWFDKYWEDKIKNGGGEPGIFNNQAVRKLARSAGRATVFSYGCNPCGEIILRPNQACNLSEVIIRPDDTLPMLLKKIRHAVTLGVYQSRLTNFYSGLDFEFTENCDDERLLGVSLTGLRDHPELNHVSSVSKKWLTVLRHEARKHADELCEEMGWQRPKAITCIKPSGTVSKLMNTSSGMHPRYAPYYIQRVRSAWTDPLTQFMIEQGMPWEPEVGETRYNCNTVVFSFPVKAPEGAMCVKDVTALEQLEYYSILQKHYCDHKPSCTVYVREDEWDDVRDWMYDHWAEVSGITFFPVNNSVYEQAPYEEITQEEYEKLRERLPVIDFKQLTEAEDQTEGAKEIACSGGACEI